MNPDDVLPGDIVYWATHKEMYIVVGYTHSHSIDFRGNKRKVALLLGHGELLYYTFQPDSQHELIR